MFVRAGLISCLWTSRRLNRATASGGTGHQATATGAADNFGRLQVTSAGLVSVAAPSLVTW